MGDKTIKTFYIKPPIKGDVEATRLGNKYIIRADIIKNNPTEQNIFYSLCDKSDDKISTQDVKQQLEDEGKGLFISKTGKEKDQLTVKWVGDEKELCAYIPISINEKKIFLRLEREGSSNIAITIYNENREKVKLQDEEGYYFNQKNYKINYTKINNNKPLTFDIDQLAELGIKPRGFTKVDIEINDKKLLCSHKNTLNINNIDIDTLEGKINNPKNITQDIITDLKEKEENNKPSSLAQYPATSKDVTKNSTTIKCHEKNLIKKQQQSSLPIEAIDAIVKSGVDPFELMKDMKRAIMERHNLNYVPNFLVQYAHIGLKISEICSKKGKKDDCYFTILGCSEVP